MRAFQSALLTILVSCGAAEVDAAQIDPTSVAFLRSRLDDTGYARIGIAGRTWVPIGAEVTPTGLTYDRRPGFTGRRPALFVWPALSWARWLQTRMARSTPPRSSSRALPLGRLMGAGIGALATSRHGTPTHWEQTYPDPE